ncbi:hypothetical protein JCM10212_003726, partial [Sporobolomyces blumeae]
KTYEHNLQQLQKDLDLVLVQAARTSSSATSAHLAPEFDDSERLQVLAKVDAMLSRMKGLKKKLQGLERQTNLVNDLVRERMHHLASVPPALEHSSYPAWASKRLSHHLVDYMLRASPPLNRSAQALADELGVARLVDQELWQELSKVETALRDRDLDQVLSWIGENRTALRKLKSPLEFTIHLQRYIELCRTRSLPKAIVYARKNLSPSTLSEFDPPSAFDGSGATRDAGPDQTKKMDPMEELKRAMALLAYGPETTCRIYADLYSPRRWTHLTYLFRTTFLTLHSLPSVPLLHMSLQAGLASLKTPICCPLPTDSTAGSGPTTTNGEPSTNWAQAPFGGTGVHPGAPWVSGHPGMGTLTISPSGQLTVVRPSRVPSPATPAPTLPLASSIPHPAPPPPPDAASDSTSPCPLCSSPLRQLVASVPYSHHTNSTIVCPLTGKVVEGDGGEGGRLVALVSRVGTGAGIAGGGEGRVYSREGLEMRALQHPEHKVIEPVTGEVFDWSELKKAPRTASIFLIDCSSSMNRIRSFGGGGETAADEGKGKGKETDAGEDGGTRRAGIEVAKEFVKAKVVQRIMRDLKTIPCAVILFGYMKTKNLLTTRAKDLAAENGVKFDRADDVYQGIYELVPLTFSCDMSTVQRVDDAVAGQGADGDAHSALITAIETITAQTSLKSYPMREVFILTDGESEIDWDSYEGTIGRMVESNICVRVIGIDFDDEAIGFVEKDKSSIKCENEAKFRAIVDTLNSQGSANPSLLVNATRALDTIMHPRIKPVNSRADRIRLTLGDPQGHPDRSIVMHVEVKKAIVPATMPSMKKMSLAGFVKTEQWRERQQASQSQGQSQRRGRAEEPARGTKRAREGEEGFKVPSKREAGGQLKWMGSMGATLEKTLKTAGLEESDDVDADVISHDVAVERRYFYRPIPKKPDPLTAVSSNAGPSQVRVTRRERLGADSDEDDDSRRRGGGYGQDDDEEELKELQDGAELGDAYFYGGDLIPVGDFEEGVGKLGGLEMGMEILTFMKKDDIRYDWRIGDAFYVYGAVGHSGSEKMFSALINAMEEKDSCAVVRFEKKGYTSSKTGQVVMPDPQLGILFPTSNAERSEFCYWIRLPFGEDVRSFSFPSLTNLFNRKGVRIETHPHLPTEEQDRAMDDFVDAMDLNKAATVDANGETIPWFDIHESYSPAIHNLQNTLMFRLTNPDGDLPPVPRVLTRYMDPPEILVDSAKEQTKAVIDAFKVKLLPPKPKKATKATSNYAQPETEVKPDYERLYGHSAPQEQIAAAKAPRASQVTVNAVGLEVKDGHSSRSQSLSSPTKPSKPFDEETKDGTATKAETSASKTNEEDDEMGEEPATEDDEDYGEQDDDSDGLGGGCSRHESTRYPSGSKESIRELVDEAAYLVDTSFSSQNFTKAKAKLRQARESAIETGMIERYNGPLIQLIRRFKSHKHANFLDGLHELGVIHERDDVGTDGEEERYY